MAYKPLLVTRQETATTRSTETLNKGSKLSFQEMDENFLQLQKGSISVVGDDSTGSEVNLGDTLKVAGTGGIATSVSGDTVTIDASSIVTSSLGDLTAVGSTLISPSNADITLSPAGTGNINADSNKIINVADPTSAQDAATKSYVDTQVSAVGGGGDLGNLQVNNTTLTPITTNDDLVLTANGTGDVLIQTDSGTLTYIGENKSSNVFTFLPSTGIMRYQGDMNVQTNNGAQIILKDATNNGDINFTNLAGGFNRFGSGSNLAYITSNGAYDLRIGVNDWDTARPRMELDYDGDFTLTAGDGQNVRINPQLIVDGNLKFNDNSITTTASNSNLELSANGTGTVVLENLKVGTGSTVTTILDEDTMSSNSATALATQQSIKAYVDAEDANIASDTLTFTNKTIDANGTGNSITNLEVADFAAASIVTAAEGISSNNNDTTIPTSAAVKAYADSVGGGGGTGDIVFSGNEISTGSSNANLVLTASGTGVLELKGGTNTIQGEPSTDIRINPFGSASIILDDPVASLSQFTSDRSAGGKQIVAGKRPENIADVGAKRAYYNQFSTEQQLDNQASSSSNARFRNIASELYLDLNGADITPTSSFKSRGPACFYGELKLDNTNSSNATMSQVPLNQSYGRIETSSTGNLTVNDYLAYNANLDLSTAAGTTVQLDNVTAYRATTFGSDFGSGTTSITNFYAFQVDDNVTNATNKYLISGPDAFESEIGTIKKYQEKIVALTDDSSNNTGVDASLAPVFTMTVNNNEIFEISNLAAGKTVTLILTQGSAGSATATFVSDASVAVKFPGGAPTLSSTAGQIDVVTIFNDGTNLLGNIAQNYS